MNSPTTASNVIANLPRYRTYELRAMVSDLLPGQTRPRELTAEERVAVNAELAKRAAVA